MTFVGPVWSDSLTPPHPTSLLPAEPGVTEGTLFHPLSRGRRRREWQRAQVCTQGAFSKERNPPGLGCVVLYQGPRGATWGQLKEKSREACHTHPALALGSGQVAVACTAEKGCSGGDVKEVAWGAGPQDEVPSPGVGQREEVRELPEDC